MSPDIFCNMTLRKFMVNFTLEQGINTVSIENKHLILTIEQRKISHAGFHKIVSQDKMINI